ncbi:piggyBac transposable element-derived protein 4-like [Aplysia californica]|uniref:PiggyBac transposable element-derived protein 4-like n=1 Tax=Aplysia californica TaxID=6500 RepID=A0ABM1W4U5_APLCA|nr:piggyBac transposable element-derived protein 4-like [Aplysia californica]
MGLVPKQNLKDFWTNSGPTRTPWFSRTMSRDRFFHILWDFHISDVEEELDQDQDNRDRLFKVRPLIKRCLDSFSSAYSPQRDLAVDEATCPFKGRLRFKVYNPAKPNRFGIKLYTLCESSSGYCLYFDVYCAQLSPLDEAAVSTGLPATAGSTEKIVCGLMEKAGCLRKGHHLYMDNYYLSPALFQHLAALNTYACGTVRPNRRGLPSVFRLPVNANMSEFQTVARVNDRLTAIKYQHKRSVHVLSSIHDPTGQVIYKPRRKTAMKPSCILDYCSKMGGVDLMDQVTSYYEISRRSLKWWRKLAFYLMDLCLVNAFQLYLKFSPAQKKLTHAEFRKSIVETLVSEAPSARRPTTQGGKRRATTDVPALPRLTERHFSRFIPAAEGSKRSHGARDCVVCNLPAASRKGCKRQQTSHWCQDCNAPLCYPECFILFHTKMDYQQEARRQELGGYKRQKLQ